MIGGVVFRSARRAAAVSIAGEQLPATELSERHDQNRRWRHVPGRETAANRHAMRDTDSIAITLTLAETGHLVFSTLHTNDASQALDRIVDVFPAERQAQIRMQLAGSLSGVIAQRLVPKSRRGGLVAAYEVLLATHAVRNLVREAKTRQIRNVITTSQGDGMMTLEMSLSRLVASGHVAYDDAVMRAIYPAEVDRPVAPPAKRFVR